MRHQVRLGGVLRPIDDISAGGCFVAGPAETDRIGSILPLELQLGSLAVSCRGEVMRVTDAGCGVRFVGLARSASRRLRRALEDRFALRHRVEVPASWHGATGSLPCTVLNLSSGGCYLRADAQPSEGSRGIVELRGRLTTRTLKATVAWTNAAAEHDKPAGFGVRFAPRHARLARILAGPGRLELTR
jgi:hypothetical protein